METKELNEKKMSAFNTIVEALLSIERPHRDRVYKAVGIMLPILGREQEEDEAA